MIVDKTRKPEKDWTPEEIVAFARGHHMWINAFKAGMGMNTEDYEQIGRWVVDELLNSKMGDDLSGSFPMVYLRVNAS